MNGINVRFVRDDVGEGWQVEHVEWDGNDPLPDRDGQTLVHRFDSWDEAWAYYRLITGGLP